MRWKLLSILLALILIGSTISVLAEPTKSKVEIIPVNNQISLNDIATFDLKITNTANEKQRFSIYSIAQGFIMEPSPLKDKIVGIAAKKSHTVRLTVRTLENLKPGIYHISITIESDLGEQHDESLKLYLSPEEPLDYLPSIKVMVDMDEKIDPKESVSVKLFLENRNPLDLTNLKVFIQSDIPEFTKEATVDLPPLEKKTVEFTINPNKFQQPKDHFLFFVFEHEGQVVKVIDKKIEIISVIPQFMVEASQEKTFMQTFTNLQVTNEGNVLNTQEVKYPVTFWNYWFVSGAQKKTIEDEKFVTWEVSLGPNESTELNYLVNYRLPFYLLLVFLFFVAFAYYVKSPVSVRKTGVTTKIDDEGALSELKITLEIKNKLNKPIKGIAITDIVPAIANVEKSLQLGTLRPHKIKHTKNGTKVIWTMAELDGLEHRLITYKIKAKLNILGTFSLPRAHLEYDKGKGKKKGKVYSNVFSLSA